MKALLPSIILALLVQLCVADDFTLTDGTEYKGVTVKRVEPDGIVVTTDSGITKLPFSKLPAEVQTAHGFNPSSADEFKKQQQALQAAAYAKAAEDRKKAEIQAKQLADVDAQQAAADAKQKTLKSTAASVRIKIIQVLPGGVLADRMQEAVVSSSSASIGGGGGAYSYYERSGDVFYYEGVQNVAEGDGLDVVAGRDGTYTYTDTSGASRTVQKWKILSQAPKKK